MLVLNTSQLMFRVHEEEYSGKAILRTVTPLHHIWSLNHLLPVSKVYTQRVPQVFSKHLKRPV